MGFEIFRVVARDFVFVLDVKVVSIAQLPLHHGEFQSLGIIAHIYMRL